MYVRVCVNMCVYEHVLSVLLLYKQVFIVYVLAQRFMLPVCCVLHCKILFYSSMISDAPSQTKYH